MKIAIPSYNRVSILKEKTLKMVLDAGYNPDDIYVFLSSIEEQENYMYQIQDPIHFIVTDCKNLSEKRTYIRNYFPEGEEILAIDDDVKKIKMLNPEPLQQLVKRMFELVRENKITTWGIYPVNQSNLFYCKDRVVLGSVYIIACFYGFINTKQEDYPEVCGKEDKWYSCLRIKSDGATLRYEGCCPDTGYYAKGGLSGSRTNESEEKYSKFIANQYPELVRYKLKKNGHPDVEFIRKKNKVFSLYHQPQSESTSSLPLE